MIWKQAAQATRVVPSIESRTLKFAAILLAVMFAIACGSGSDDSPLPTFASPPTITPVVEQVQPTPQTTASGTSRPSAEATSAPASGGATVRLNTDSAPSSRITPSNAAPTPVFTTSAVAARFIPDNVKLELDGDTQAVRVEATGIDPRANGFQIHLLHPSNVEIESMSCLGLFKDGFVLGPAPLDDGALVGCASLKDVEQTRGEVMEFALKRIAPGLAEVAIRESDDIGDAFFSEFVWSGDDAGEQAIVGEEPLTVRD